MNVALAVGTDVDAKVLKSLNVVLKVSKVNYRSDGTEFCGWGLHIGSKCGS